MDLSPDPSDPFSFGALEARFARERAEREAIEGQSTLRDGHGGAGDDGQRQGPGGAFQQQQQQQRPMATYAPNDIYDVEDETAVGGAGEGGWGGAGAEAVCVDNEIISTAAEGRHAYPASSLSSFQLAPTRPVPNRSAFNPPVHRRQASLLSSRPRQPPHGTNLTQGNFVSARDLHAPPMTHPIAGPSRGSQDLMGGVYARSGKDAQAVGSSQQVPMKDEGDEFEREFGDGAALWAVDEDYVLRQQHAGPSFQPDSQRAAQTPVVRPPAPRGDKLVPVSALPDRYRSLFKFGVFNAVQSKCFDPAMHSDENMVVSSPTGSGKTVVFELAVIRLLETGDYGRAVYLAPTKSLCAERMRDWSAKFAGIGIKCVEMTSDTTWGPQAFQPILDARIIICTPEKWDSITRWKGGSKEGKLLDSVALLMIDEVHLLREKRGAVLEVVVARMKAIDTAVRFVALSATVPNVVDVGRWLRPPSASESGWFEGDVDVEQIPSAKVLTFGDEYRPCKLTKRVIAFPRKDGTNIFMFVRTLEKKVFELLSDNGEGKPVLIFCPTRKIVESCAEQLYKDMEQAGDRKARLPWKTSKALLGSFADKKLQKLASKGIAFHHAGMSIEDRRLVETSFIQGSIMVVVSTSTLTVGVNLPAHTVVILGTQGYTTGVGMVDYSDLDIIQMIGRAGRPQYDKTGLALILTAQGQERKFDAVAGGTTILESNLHENLIEHLNSETALGTITDIPSAVGWLHSSFFYIRLLRNPAHYVKSLGAASAKVKESPVKALELFVQEAYKSLNQVGLVEHEEGADAVLSTNLGEVMSKRYIRFGTMKRILDISEKVTFRDLLETLCEAEEFEDVRLRADEKTGYREMGRSDRMRFAVKEVKTTKDKVLVLIQIVCGGHALSEIKVDSQTVMQSLSVFRHAPRIAQTILDVGLLKESGSIVKHGLELLRSMNSKAFETGTCIFRILDKIGDKALQIFAQNRITTFADLASDARRIERLLNRNPPFGTQIVEQIKALPKFTLEVIEHDTRSFNGEAPVEVDLEVIVTAAVGKQHKIKGHSLTVSCLVVTSDLELVDFRRSSIKNFKTPQSYEVTALMTRPSQLVHIVITCNEIAGVSSFANYHPAVAASEYPAPDTRPKKGDDSGGFDDEYEHLMDDVEFAAVDLDQVEATGSRAAVRSTSKDEDAILLPNGRYACQHQCKDKATCGHACCKQGLRHPRRVSRVRSGGSNDGGGVGQLAGTTSQGTHHPVGKKMAVKGQLSPQVSRTVGDGQQQKRRRLGKAKWADSSDANDDDNGLRVAGLKSAFVKPEASKPAPTASATPARIPPATAKAAFRGSQRSRALNPPSERSNIADEASEFPPASSAIAQTLSSGKAKLTRLAYQPTSPPPLPSLTQVPSASAPSSRPAKRMREPTRPPPQSEDARQPSSDDLIDFDIGAGGDAGVSDAVHHDGRRPYLTQSAIPAPSTEPLFLPVSASSSSSPPFERAGADVKMTGRDAFIGDDGRVDLDRLLDLDSINDEPPARKRQKGGEVQRGQSASQGHGGSAASSPAPRPLATRPSNLAARAASAAVADQPKETEDGDDATLDTLKWMEQFVVD